MDISKLKLRQRNDNPYEEEDEYSNHGKHSRANKRRTQEVETRFAQEDQSGKAEEAPRLRPRIEKAQSEEAGTRPIETLGCNWQQALGIWPDGSSNLKDRRPVANG